MKEIPIAIVTIMLLSGGCTTFSKEAHEYKGVQKEHIGYPDGMNSRIEE